MAHKEQKKYLDKIKEKFPKAFKNCKVLDIGSFDVNGNEKPWFENCDFIGLDLGPGKGVDVVCPAQEYDAPNESFDTIISCECWEHNPFYKESIQNAVRMLKPGGYFIFTCATTGRPIHGTKTQDEIDRNNGVTPQGNKTENWITMPNVFRNDWDNDYYRNVTEDDIRNCIDVDGVFSSYEFEVEENHCDLYFWGIKNK
jgi:SAM-dependent methyltransferase